MLTISPINQPTFEARPPKRVLTKFEVQSFAKRGMAIKDIANECGMSPFWVNNWLNRLNISYRKLKKQATRKNVKEMISKPIKAKDAIEQLGMHIKTFETYSKGKYREVQRNVKRMELEKLLKEGLTTEQIAERLGVSRDTVWVIKGRWLLTSRNKIARENLERVREKYLQGMKPKEISEAIGLSLPNVYKYINKINAGA